VAIVGLLADELVQDFGEVWVEGGVVTDLDLSVLESRSTTSMQWLPRLTM
jgi:hypothetical protein